jgi:hypothetical protein
MNWFTWTLVGYGAISLLVFARYLVIINKVVSLVQESNEVKIVMVKNFRAKAFLDALKWPYHLLMNGVSGMWKELQ